MIAPEGYRIERGLLWPAADRGAAAVLFDQVKDLEVAYRHCRAFGVAVQAGGNCGIWPAAMGQRFGRVYSFEPDPVNFRCLAANAPAENIFKFNAALGDAHGGVALELRPDNVGAHQVAGPGPIPVMRIDDLELDACDLIYLDIEGFELIALAGAIFTIRRHRPVVVVEDKGMSQRYGSNQGAIEAWMAGAFDYKVVERVHRDVVLVP
jgi:FkbM family methyltransferase